MTKKRKAPTPKKEWEPLTQTPDWAVKVKHFQVMEQVRVTFPGVPVEEIKVPAEVWGSSQYTVTVHYLDDNRDGFVEVGIHNYHRTTHVPWRHIQQIKNEVFGPDREAVQLFPAEDRLLDAANEYWIYVYPTGTAPMRERGVKLGMDRGRQVTYDMPPMGKARQAPPMKIANQKVTS
jgi:hypothetical protein